MSKVSVLIAHLNSFNPLQYTIISQIQALEFAGVDYEIIICDNGSDSAHLEQLGRWIENMKPHPIILYHESVKGTIPPYETASEHATGDILCMCDHHIAIPHSYYSDLLPFFKDEGIGTLYSSVSFYGPRAQKVYHYNFNAVSLHTKFAPHEGNDPYAIATAQMIVPLIRSELFYKMGRFNKGAFVEAGGYTAEETMLGIKTWMFGYDAVMVPSVYSLHGNMIGEAGSHGKREKADSLTILTYLLMGKDKAREAFDYWQSSMFKPSVVNFNEFLAKHESYILPQYEYIQRNQLMSYDEVYKLWEERGVPH